ncbi:MAG: TonB-dependent receptor [Tannerellaceae bacterium]|jgi:outer membrane receptor for ferrienterochelin and colicin|nr:TonB-dependent receptor [Tannerellaceae bacterium]
MKRFFLLVMTIWGMNCFISAQVTTSSISGKVADANNKAVIGATVQAVHEPSGTYYGGVTNTDGHYTIQGMRVGGPYKVAISYIGNETAVFTGIMLKLGGTTDISVKLEESSELLAEVVVVGQSGIDASKTGAAMGMNAEQIVRMPSISGSIADIIRLTPQISISNSGAMSFAGTNNRYNSFQIDGAMNNDVFGLTTNGSNGGQAGTQSVSMETIEQIQVNVAPYDVRQSGFTGGAINAITKSGTNTFHGSVYGFGNNQSLIGKKYTLMNGETSEKYNDQDEYRAGVTLGGPVVKNKLFFFANYESANKKYPNAYGLNAAASNVDAGRAKDILGRIKEMAQAQGVTYNGSFNESDVYTKSDKAGVKLDWNIHDRHKASLRWSMVSARQLNMTSTASNLNTSDYAYDFVSKTNSFIAELQSRLSDKVSNEFRASFVRVRDRRDPGSPFPMISVANVGGGNVNIGNERSSMLNRLDQDIWSFTDNLTLYQGDHTFTFGTHNEFSHFANLFIQDAYGTYYYNNMDDFLAGKINQYRFSQANVSVTGNPRWEAAFSAGQLGFYAQDKWNATDRLVLTLGLRMDIPLFFDAPAENTGFNGYAASKGWDYETNRKLSSSPMFSPRAGFRYTVDNDGKFILRGGAGIFTGRIPFVWLSNNFSNTGIQLSIYNTNAAGDLSLILDPGKQAANLSQLTAGGSQLINVFSKNFKFPQTMRANVGLDVEWAGIDWTAEAIYSKTLNDILYQNLAYGLNGNTLGQAFPDLNFDQRPLFERVTTGTDYSLIYALSNTNKGYSYNLSLKGEKKFDIGLDLMASYTYTRSKSVNSGTSSVAQSNWAYNYTRGNPNDPEVGFSAFNFPHRINASVFYHKSYAKAWTTVAGLIYTGSSGAPYSIYYAGRDLNGDSANGNDLIFIPTDAQIDQMQFGATSDYTVDAQKTAMKAWIAGDPYLSLHRGEYFERYADNEKFEHHFDFHLAQKYSFHTGGTIHSLELSFDILNVGNLFNKEWGRYASAGGSATYYSPITYSGNGVFQFLHDKDYNMRSYGDYYSRWRGQVSLKYTF